MQALMVSSWSKSERKVLHSSEMPVVKRGKRGAMASVRQLPKK